jgi:glycogen debranching enzyme
VSHERAGLLAARLCSEELFSGWGVRTMSTSDAGFNPIAYHNGTVWPHDNALIVAGLARYGFREEAARLAQAMLEAAVHFRGRLPEAFAGYARTATDVPVRFPTAASPQAWASAAPVELLRELLGLHPSDGTLGVDPFVPDRFGDVAWEGVPAFGGRFDVRAAGRSGRAERQTRP